MLALALLALTLCVEALKPDSGFVQVNASADSHLFYWYFPGPSQSAPTTVWLNGGPGSSSFIGAFGGLGPYSLLKNGSLVPRSLGAWTEFANLVVVDQPVGVGFSYSREDAGYPTTQSQVADNFLVFLDVFFGELHPELTGAFFLAGESYAGKYIPAIGAAIVGRGPGTHYKFRGAAIGNGLTEPQAMALTMSASYYSLGLIDTNQRDHGELLQQKAVDLAKAGDWVEATNARGEFQEYLSNVTGGANNEDVRRYTDYDWGFIEVCGFTALLSVALIESVVCSSFSAIDHRCV